ncbi:nucleotidyltransferase domain-containing protein [Yoonia sp. SS1-5]|uniref:Nucleotidyltransferase domain-containing protein n=1 Tax=Yoonia rhodophyticola TaxID=3137370 RepID=A0AAN0MFQ4_9RHOB
MADNPDTYPWAPMSPATLNVRLIAVGAIWYICGGWALDLWHGRQTRHHGDIEFCILRPDFPAFSAQFQDFDFYAAADGSLSLLANRTASPSTGTQFWGCDPATKTFAFDLMIEPGNHAEWAYKRDPTMTEERAHMLRLSADGIPYLAAPGVLLFKAKYTRDKDQFDFEMALPRLTPEDREWLRRR